MKVFDSKWIVMLALLISSCNKDTEVKTQADATSATLSIAITPYAGNDSLVYSRLYENASGEVFSVSTFMYYLSNFSLMMESGDVFMPDTYFLVDHGNPQSARFKIGKIPAGTCKGIRFLIGVDSVRNVSGVQTGALDPAHGMFWTWKSGYIMAKLEGTSPASKAGGNAFLWHAGGFSAPYSTIREVTMMFDRSYEMRAGGTLDLNLKADVLQWFKSPENIKIADISVANDEGENPYKISLNYADMFSIIRISGN